jgi:hypothetical protein
VDGDDYVEAKWAVGWELLRNARNIHDGQSDIYSRHLAKSWRNGTHNHRIGSSTVAVSVTAGAFTSNGPSQTKRAALFRSAADLGTVDS